MKEARKGCGLEGTDKRKWNDMKRIITGGEEGLTLPNRRISGKTQC